MTANDTEPGCCARCGDPIRHYELGSPSLGEAKLHWTCEMELFKALLKARLAASDAEEKLKILQELAAAGSKLRELVDG